MTVTENGIRAKEASYKTASLSEDKINAALFLIADDIVKNTDMILEKNAADVKNAAENGMNEIMLDRLSLSPERISGIAAGVRQVAALHSKVGEETEVTVRPNGLKVFKRIVPLGVIAMIFESRPNVTVDAATLALKTRNAIILRGGKEAHGTNAALTEIMQKALEKSGIDKYAVQLVEDTSRDSAKALMSMKEYVDVLIPRGGAGLIKSVVENSTVDIIETGTGNCHIYIDETADAKKAVDIVINAKTSRPSVCNAAESVLIHEKAAERILPELFKALSESGVTVYGCDRTREIIPCKKATEDDFYKEYLALEISVKVVKDTFEAISHINKYGTHHSEAIISEDENSVGEFFAGVDSAALYHNASTRFTDGFEFGFGAEIGISTQKLHVRGPMGLDALTTYKYIVRGNGQTR